MITSLGVAISNPPSCIYPGCHYVWTGRTPCTGEKKCIRCGTVVATVTVPDGFAVGEATARFTTFVPLVEA